ncbi:MAG: hypothetical protein HXY44_11750 [Syntrophaceae bacterium]|nr:hypothetical protein [Syntrophaceae bacterium]
MEKKDCFGSIKEIILKDGQTITQTKPECRNCDEIRDCLRTSKQLEAEKREQDELRKQNLIAQIIDHSHVLSNELGSCLLTFLSRVYSSPFGSIFFKNLLLFYELPKDSVSSNLTIPISRTVLNLIHGGDQKEPTGLGDEFTLRIVLFQRSFQKKSLANMGMIAYEVARTLASDDFGIKQIFQILSDAEASLFKRMDSEARTNWLIEKWGFLDEYEALKKEMAATK